MTPELKWAVALGVSLGAGAFALDRIALALIRPPRRPVRGGVASLPYPSRPVAFTSLGQPLTGWLIEPEAAEAGSEAAEAESEPAEAESDRLPAGVVLVHGWGANHESVLPLAGPLLRAGHPVFVFDVRIHGESPPAPFITARHYRDDVLAAIGKASELLPGRPLVLVGHSMGGVASILAVAEGADVVGLVSISAPADVWDVWARQFQSRGLPGRWIVRTLRPFWRVRAGVPFETLRPDRRARELELPFLVLHGSEDSSVAPWHARRLAEEAGTEAVVFPGKGHSDLMAGSGLHERLLEFLRDAVESGGRATGRLNAPG